MILIRLRMKVGIWRYRCKSADGRLLTDDPGVATGGWTTPGIVN